jgi:hypothetical protein
MNRLINAARIGVLAVAMAGLAPASWTEEEPAVPVADATPLQVASPAPAEPGIAPIIEPAIDAENDAGGATDNDLETRRAALSERIQALMISTPKDTHS